MATQNVVDKKLATNARVYINGDEYHFVSLELDQAFGEHHHFKITMDYDTMKDRFMGDPSKHMRLIREILDIDLLQGDDSASVYEFRGVITNVYHEGREGKHGYLVLEGQSPTVLLERGKRMDIFTRMDLKRVFEDVVSGIYNKQLSYVNNPVYTGRVEFLMQYNESDWEFLRRLSAITGETLYYTGRDLVFGTHKDFKEITVTYDYEITGFQFGSRLQANNFSRYQYLPGRDDTIKHDTTTNIENANDYVKDAGERVKDFGEKRPVRKPALLEVSDIGALTEMVNREKVSNAAHTVYVKGTAKTCSPRLGRILTIKMPANMPEASDIGAYRITKVRHVIDQNQRYKCEFEGIPAALKYYPVPQVHTPVADSIRGVVISNEDPDGQGRIRVDFPFATDRPSETWLRVMTPSAGLTSDKQKNRGMVFIPEKGDQVMVGFEFGDPNRPYVMGSMFHGMNGQGGQAKNHIKSIITQSGHTIELDDAKDTLGITIKDTNGNKIHIDSKGNNIEITALETISLNAKNISMNAEESIVGHAGQNIDMNANNNLGFIAGDDCQLSANNIYTKATTDSMHTAKKYEVTAEKVRIDSTNENLELASSQEVDIQSVKKVRLF